jgi:hypothetical protein
MDAGVQLRREKMQKSVKSMPSTIAHCVLVTGYVDNMFFILENVLFCLVHDISFGCKLCTGSCAHECRFISFCSDGSRHLLNWSKFSVP